MIPNILWQSWKTKNIPLAVRQINKTWEISNPKLEKKFMDDQECSDFILKYFGNEIHKKYINLPQSIMRADFWRIAVVYIYGGYYSDLDIEVNSSLKDLIPNLDKKETIFIKELNNISNFFFGATPKHPVLKMTLNLMIDESEHIINMTSQNFGMHPLHQSVRKYFNVEGTNYVSNDKVHFLQNEQLTEDKKFIHIGASGFDKKLGDYISWRRREKIMIEEREQSNNILFFTTFNKNGYDLYGKTWVNSFIKVANYYNKFKAKIYYEGFKPKDTHSSIEWVDFKKEIPQHEQWKKEYLEKNKHADYVKTMCVRFSHKAFVIQDILSKHNDDYLIWLDGDCIYQNENFTEFPKNILQNKFMACQLEHASDLNHVESGILIFDGKHPDTKIFNKHFIENYNVDNVVKMGEPYDGFIVFKSLITSQLDYLDLNNGYSEGGIQSNPSLTFLHPQIKKRFVHNIGWTGKNQYNTFNYVKERDDILKKLENVLFGNKKEKQEKRKRLFNKLETLHKLKKQMNHSKIVFEKKFNEIVDFKWMTESEGKNFVNDNMIKNLYRFILCREPKLEEIQNYNNHPDANDLVKIFLKSNEFKKIIQQNIIPKDKKILDIPYVIVKINDRALDNCNTIEMIMKSSKQYKFSFINDQENVIEKFLLKHNIKINWDKKFFIRDYLKGELGVTASFVLIYQYMIDNNIDKMLVFEDDAVLKDNFLNNLYYCYNDLPNDFDYLVSSTVFPNARITSSVNDDILINSKYICKSYLQNSDLRVTLYSKNGVKKILNFLKQFGFVCPIDTFIFNLTRKNYLNGYTTFFQNSLVHNVEIGKSLIDENKLRMNFNI